MNLHSLTILTLASLLLAGCSTGDPASQASAGESIAFTPKGDEARGAEDYAWSNQAGIDQQAHPDYNSRTSPLIAGFFINGDRDIFRDPYHHQWLEDERGSYQATSFVNRYGANLHVDLYGPPDAYTDTLTGQADAGPYPVVMLLPGYGADVLLYEGFSQQIAENGYVVVVITPQDQAPSDSEPSEEFCDPDGEWKEPQEGGITERGACAGQDGAGAPPVFVGGDDTQAQDSFDAYEADYQTLRSRYVFAALDAADWLTENSNVWSHRMDLSRLGIVGHSVGADGALIAANLDPQQRFDVVIPADTYGRPDFIDYRVPMMVQFSEVQSTFGPYPVAWNPTLHTGVYTGVEAMNAGTPMMAIALRGSNHAEWNYVPYRLMNPVAPLTNVSAKGFQISLYYSLAWLDYHLKGASLVHQQDAERRLLARSFDDSVDRSNISTGTADPATGGNAPYMIAGEAVQDHLSVWFPNFLSFGGYQCLDWHEGCGFGE